MKFHFITLLHASRCNYHLPILAVWMILWLLFVILPSTAQATLYQCKDAAGHKAYVQKTKGYTDCKVKTLDTAKAPSYGRKQGSGYRIVHADGHVEYTNKVAAKKPGQSITPLFNYDYIVTCMACNVASPLDWQHVPLHLHDFASAIHKASKDYAVEPAFIRAIIHAESAFRPRALSSKGAQGLMQLMPQTAQGLGVTDAFDINQNIDGGSKYLQQMLRRFGGDKALAAAAYNAGPGAVSKHQGVPPFAETKMYVKRVQLLYERYKKALAENG